MPIWAVVPPQQLRLRAPRFRRPARAAAYASLLAALAALAGAGSAGALERPRDGWIVFTSDDVDGGQILSVPVAAGSPSQRTLLFAGGEPETPALSPDGELIAFAQGSVWSPGRERIWLTRIDGGRRRLLAKGSFPTWSPDSRRLAFIDHSGRLATIGRDGSSVRPLVQRLRSKIRAPLWSPDGAWIAYTIGEDQLWVVRSDGTRSHRVAKARPQNFSWSPNGRRLAYAGAGSDDLDIFTVSVAGGRAKRLTKGQGVEGQPQWSPDGTRIAFWREWALTMVVAADGSSPARRLLPGSAPSWSPDGSKLAVRRGAHVWVARADGRGARRVSRGTGSPSGSIEWEPGAETRPVWTAGGRRILFSRLSHVPGELVAISPANGQRRRLTRNRAHELEPSWSPNGRRIAFVRVVGRGPTRTQEICVMRADGTRFRRLTRGKLDSQPTWSPDGTRIVFKRQTGTETAALYLVPAAGGRLKRLAPLTTGHPAWAPGRLIAVDGIELMSPAGKPAGRATYPTEFMRDSQLDWAPDGRRFVFLRYENLQCRQCEIEYLVTGELGTSSVRRIDTSFEEFISPSWSPDGRRIAAVTAEGGRLITMRPDGSDRRVVAGTLGGESPEIDWGPGP